MQWNVEFFEVSKSFTSPDKFTVSKSLILIVVKPRSWRRLNGGLTPEISQQSIGSSIHDWRSDSFDHSIRRIDQNDIEGEEYRSFEGELQQWIEAIVTYLLFQLEVNLSLLVNLEIVNHRMPEESNNNKYQWSHSKCLRFREKLTSSAINGDSSTSSSSVLFYNHQDFNVKSYSNVPTYTKDHSRFQINR